MSRIVKSGNVSMNDSQAFVVETKRIEPAREAYALEPEQENDGSVPEDEAIILKARREAERIIKTANVDAEILLQDVKAQAEQLCSQAEIAAREEGYRQGYKAGMEETEKMKSEAGAIIDGALEQRRKTLEELEPQIVGLIIDIVDKLLSAGLSINPQIITTLIRKGMAESTITGDINIRVSAMDFGNVVASRTELMSLISGSGNIEIIKDAALEHGDCIIETAFGNIDVSLDRQFDSLKNDLMLLCETGE